MLEHPSKYHSGNSTDIESEMLGVTFGDIHIESLGNRNIDVTNREDEVNVPKRILLKELSDMHHLYLFKTCETSRIGFM